jgi:hypothetical protein
MSRALRAVTSRALAGALLAAAVASPLHAQAGVLGAPVTVTLAAALPPSLTVLVIAGATQTIPSLTSGALNTFPTPAQVQTSWDLRPNSGTVSLVAYFTQPTQAMVSGANVIPSSRIRARMTSGSVPAFTPISGAGAGGVGTAGGSLVLFTFPICNSNACRRVTRTDPLDLQLDLTSLVLRPGTYTGTLNLRAVTY